MARDSESKHNWTVVKVAIVFSRKKYRCTIIARAALLFHRTYIGSSTRQINMTVTELRLQSLRVH